MRRILAIAFLTLAITISLRIALRAQTKPSVTVAWTNPAQPQGDVVSALNVYRNAAAIAKLAPTETLYVDSSSALTPGKSYTYDLTATVNDAETGPSPSATVTIPVPQNVGVSCTTAKKPVCTLTGLTAKQVVTVNVLNSAGTLIGSGTAKQ